MGDDTLIDQVRRRYLEVNGDHPMSEADDVYVREHFVEATPEAMALMLEGRLPLPSYLLSDGTPMVPAEHGRLAEIAGGVDRLHDWFVAFWPDDPATAEEEWGHYLSGQYVCLTEVSPVRIRMKTRRVAEASVAVEILRRDPHDPIGRGMLGQAVDGVLAVPGLESFLLPMTAYDRLRFGGPTVRETWVEAPRREFLTPVAPVWPLRTERLLLRPFRPGDEPALTEAWADEDYTSLLLSGTMNPAEVAEMVRRRSEPGDGTFIGLVAEHDGEVVGDSVLILQGTGLSEGEIGWTVMPRHAGRGYATEAARAVLRLAFEHYGLRRVVANLDARNDRSAALCERLGMRREVHRRGDFWSKGTWTDSYEYALLREEWLAQQP
ncbi:GNAT family N-acetyltransferase [Nocardioides sp.]|uniref:GNAT family N-acetyltransferase n=1 Tax=Nocardioides sp. TaxID=35761 RepID=UPI0035AE8EE5